MKFTFLFLLLVSSSLLAVDRPNVVLILTDDMGYSDLGCYGSEIETPNLDSLATKGLKLTNFNNTGRCCPTRAALLTGKYSQLVGFGHMDTDRGKDRVAYRGHLLESTVAEDFQKNGYATFMTGKWHLGSKNKEWWPTRKGFENFYGVPQGGGFYFTPKSMKAKREVVLNDQLIYDSKNEPPKSWYATDAFTTEGLKFVDAAVENKKPFFWYVAYNAPHFPLQAKPDDIAKYRGRYNAGWKDVREKRFENMKKLGFDFEELSPIEKKANGWDKLSVKEKDKIDLRMATYAAMVDNVDQNVGKIVKRLKEQGVLENTIIIFLSDNGADSSGGFHGKNTGKGVCGTAESFSFAGQGWANVSNTPFRFFKKWNHEGGITNPAIFHWPKGITPSGVKHDMVHMIDVAPTLFDVCGISSARTFSGESFSGVFKAKSFEREEPLFFEHEGNCAIKTKDWKLVKAKTGSWELYKISDRDESNNLAESMPEKVKYLRDQWRSWAKASHVFPSPFMNNLP
ncbi:MAG: arylsulfatase [Lentisphaeraceae bacterium]|nr:arylsulfatase [Lentisphaeraceae bacterium]